MFIHRLFVNVQKDYSKVDFTIPDYGLESAWHGRANITHLLQGNFFLCLLHSTSQGNYISILFVAIYCMAILETRVCNKNYKNVAALNCAMKKMMDEITLDKQGRTNRGDRGGHGPPSFSEIQYWPPTWPPQYF